LDSGAIQLRAAGPADVEAIVRVHLAAFPDFFLSRLGAGFLRQLYRTFVQDPDGICLVAHCAAAGETSRIVGFIAGSSAPAMLFRRALLHRGVAFAWAATFALLRHPLVVGRRLAAAVRYRGDPPAGQIGSGALLSSLGVAPEARQLGVGRQLVDAFCAVARDSKLKSVYLTTDNRDNEGANRFYRSLGFELSATTTRSDGRIMNTYVKSI